MQISILCSDEQHPVNQFLKEWIFIQKHLHDVELVRKKSELSGGDVLFLVSCSEIVDAVDRVAYKAALVVHASDLPKGRGWSPHIWQIIDGMSEITVSLLEARDQIDAGPIWKKCTINIPKDALWDEINSLLFKAEINLIDFAVREFNKILPFPQEVAIGASYYPKRNPVDSQIDPMKSIVSQFDKIRVCDPNRFPAFFELYGKKYKLILEKIND